MSAGGRLLCLLVCYWSMVRDVGSTNPGLKIRLSQSGLNYVATIGVQQMSAKVQGASLPDQSGESHMLVGKVHYEVKNMRVRTVFTARRYASAMYAVVVCPSVRLSVRLSVGLSVRHKSVFTKVRLHQSQLTLTIS